jgi:hypothetical protein
MHTLADVETLPVLSAPLALALTRSLLTAATSILGADASRGLRTAVGRVRTEGESLRVGYLAATAARPESVVRVADTAEDKAVGTIRRRLEDFSILPPENPLRVEAERIEGVLFPNGIGFLAGKFREEWAEVEAIQERVTEHSFAERLSALVGETFTAHLATTHAAYGEALGITSAPADAPIPTVQEPYTRLRSALSIYVGVVVSGARNEEIDLALALAALEPIAKMKAEAKARGAAEPEVLPEPMPAV